MALPDISSSGGRLNNVPRPLTPRTDRAGKAVRNLTLLTIPDEEFLILRPLLEPVELPRYRVDSEMLPLTHEFIAQMLGSGRPTVTIAAGVLERAGLIENTRGTVRILNRKRLEDAACECYGVIQNYLGNLRLE